MTAVRPVCHRARLELSPTQERSLPAVPTASFRPRALGPTLQGTGRPRPKPRKGTTAVWLVYVAVINITFIYTIIIRTFPITIFITVTNNNNSSWTSRNMMRYKLDPFNFHTVSGRKSLYFFLNNFNKFKFNFIIFGRHYHNDMLY